MKLCYSKFLIILNFFRKTFIYNILNWTNKIDLFLKTEFPNQLEKSYSICNNSDKNISSNDIQSFEENSQPLENENNIAINIGKWSLEEVN